MFMYGRKISRVHLELSSYCNLACPLCTRNYGGVKNEHVKEKHLDLERFAEIFPANELSSISYIYACGTAGDPLMSPHALKIIRHIREHSPSARIVIHTNGAYRNEKYFRTLARLLGRVGKIVFAIDGLEDTLGIYRVGANWNILMRNVKAFISEGGLASWQWIDFDYTKHQIEEAKQLSSELGFDEFFIIENNRQVKKSFGLSIKNPEPSKVTATHVKCQALHTEEIYVSSRGIVSPCCFIGGAVYNSEKHIRDHFENMSSEDRNDLALNPTDRICWKQCGVDDNGSRKHAIFEPYKNELSSIKPHTPTVRPRYVSSISAREKHKL